MDLIAFIYFLKLKTCILNLHLIRPTTVEDRLKICTKIINQGKYHGK